MITDRQKAFRQEYRSRIVGGMTVTSIS